MLFLSEQDVKECLTMQDCLEVNRAALISIATGQAQVPSRLALPYRPPTVAALSEEPEQEENQETLEAVDWTLFKPASLTNTNQMGIKVVSVRANNPAQGLPMVPATILSLNAATGQVQGVVAATYLTAARTAAGSALSTVLLQDHIQRVTVFGAGLQARMHIQALYAALHEQPIPHVTIVNRTLINAQALADQIRDEHQWATTTSAVALDDSLGVAEALSKTQVIYTTTNTMTPLFDASCVAPGTHIAGVGSYTPQMQEVSARMVDQCRVLMDTPDARHSVGDLQHLAPQHPVCLVGTALKWQQQQQQSDERNDIAPPSLEEQAEWYEPTQQFHPQLHTCTFYKSVGTAIQDVMTADWVVQQARTKNIGTVVDMD